MEKSTEVENAPFKWGGKRNGTVVDNEDVQYYESFTYNGTEYSLYDCVSIRNPTSPEFFVGKIIKMWEHNDNRKSARRIETLWFFKPKEIVPSLKGVEDVLDNEIFLGCGIGVGLKNENQLETISGKCKVICISEDVRNPQPSDEEIKLADFVFQRSYDVDTCKILDKIGGDEIGGVDVKFIFNRNTCEGKASAVQKVADSTKPSLPLTSSSVRQEERNASELSGHRKTDYGYKLLDRKKSTVAEERSNKDSRRNDCGENKDRETEPRKQLSVETSRTAEERCYKDSYDLNELPLKKQKLDSSVAESDGRMKKPKITSYNGRKDIIAKQPRIEEERRRKVSCSLDDIPQKKQNVDDHAVAVTDGRTKISHRISHDGRKPLKVENSRFAEERRSKESYCLGDIHQKKHKLVDDPDAVSDRRTEDSQKIGYDKGREKNPAKTHRGGDVK